MLYSHDMIQYRDMPSLCMKTDGLITCMGGQQFVCAVATNCQFIAMLENKVKQSIKQVNKLLTLLSCTKPNE